MQSVDKHLPSAYYVPDSVPGARETAGNKTDNIPALMELTF